MLGCAVVLQVEQTLAILVRPVCQGVVSGGRGQVEPDQLVLRDTLSQFLPVDVAVPFQPGQSWDWESDWIDS